jgi:hypothetical protein
MTGNNIGGQSINVIRWQLIWPWNRMTSVIRRRSIGAEKGRLRGVNLSPEQCAGHDGLADHGDGQVPGRIGWASSESRVAANLAGCLQSRQWTRWSSRVAKIRVGPVFPCLARGVKSRIDAACSSIAARERK